jgi:hypothetical protein
MSKWRIVGRILGVGVICVGLLYLWLDYSLRRSINRIFTPQLSADVQDLGIAIKGKLGEFYFDQKSDFATSPSSGTLPDKAKELLAAYRKDPEKYKKYASLADTVLSAARVGDELLKIPPPTQLPARSDELGSLRPDLRLDEWGRPFCIISTDNLIAVVSPGPEAHGPISCQKPNIKEKEIRKSERRIFQTAAGEVVLKIDRGDTNHSLSQALSTSP